MAISINENHTWSYTRSYTNPGASPVYINDSVTPVVDKIVQGVDTPNFRKRKARGELLPHTSWFQLECEHDFIQGGSLNGIRNSDGLTWNSTGWWPNTTPLHINDVVHAPDDAYVMSEIQRAASAIAGAGHDSLTSLAEAKQLKRMFENTAKTLRRIHRNVKSLSPSDIHSAWLEGRYGYRTLAYDIRDLNEAVNHFDEKRRIWTEKSGYSYTESTDTTHRVTWTSRWIDFDINDTTEHSVRGAVAALVQPQRFRVNPLVTGWELTRLSFVLDWAISVGDVLGAIELLALAKATTASAGTFSRTTRTVVTTSTARPGWTVQDSSQPSYNGVVTRTVRTPMSISLRPTLRGRVIRPDQVLDLTSIFRAHKTRIH